MKYASIFQYMTDRHIEGHDRIVAKNFLYPLPIFIKEKVSLVKTEAKFCNLLAEYRATMELTGVVRAEIKLTEVHEQKPDCVSISLEKSYFDPEGRNLCTSHATYYGTLINTQLSLHMVEYTDFTPTVKVDWLTDIRVGADVATFL